MSFFRREAESENPGATSRSPSGSTGAVAGARRGEAPSGPARERAVTRIAEGTRISGEVGGATELLVEGELEGRIRVENRVVVGRGGVVRGQIEAREVLVAGTVAGDVRGSERVEVGGSGKLEGDIAAPRVTIAEGAFFKGKVEMAGERGRRERPPEEPAASEAGEERPQGLFPEGGDTPAGGSAPGGGGQ